MSMQKSFNIIARTQLFTANSQISAQKYLLQQPAGAILCDAFYFIIYLSPSVLWHWRLSYR